MAPSGKRYWGIGLSLSLILGQAEWGYVYSGSVRVSAVDETGNNQVDDLQVGDIWYFPKGQAHTIQGMVFVRRQQVMALIL